MNKAYLLMLCLISASFTGCIEDEVENTIEEETNQDGNTNDSLSTNDIGFYVQVSSKNEYYIDVIRVKAVSYTHLTLPTKA